MQHPPVDVFAGRVSQPRQAIRTYPRDGRKSYTSKARKGLLGPGVGHSQRRVSGKEGSVVGCKCKNECMNKVPTDVLEKVRASVERNYSSSGDGSGLQGIYEVVRSCIVTGEPKTSVWSRDGFGPKVEGSKNRCIFCRTLPIEEQSALKSHVFQAFLCPHWGRSQQVKATRSAQPAPGRRRSGNRRYFVPSVNAPVRYQVCRTYFLYAAGLGIKGHLVDRLLTNDQNAKVLIDATEAAVQPPRALANDEAASVVLTANTEPGLLRHCQLSHPLPALASSSVGGGAVSTVVVSDGQNQHPAGQTEPNAPQHTTWAASMLEDLVEPENRAAKRRLAERICAHFERELTKATAESGKGVKAASTLAVTELSNRVLMRAMAMPETLEAAEHTSQQGDEGAGQADTATPVDAPSALEQMLSAKVSSLEAALRLVPSGKRLKTESLSVAKDNMQRLKLKLKNVRAVKRKAQRAAVRSLELELRSIFKKGILKPNYKERAESALMQLVSQTLQ